MSPTIGLEVIQDAMGALVYAVTWIPWTAEVRHPSCSMPWTRSCSDEAGEVSIVPWEITGGGTSESPNNRIDTRQTSGVSEGLRSGVSGAADDIRNTVGYGWNTGRC